MNNHYAHRLGYEDAQKGELCVPEMYFTNPALIRAYTLAYVSVKGENETTRQILSIYR